jgi:small subunit ribosomal protein S8
MSLTDPIADMLTRIRNAAHAKHGYADVPASKLKTEIAKILLQGGYVRRVRLIRDGKQGILRIHLKYDGAHQSVISGLQRVSKPGLRVYVRNDDIPRVQGGYGTAVISTSQGVFTDKIARQKGLGGEYLCKVW